MRLCITIPNFSDFDNQHVIIGLSLSIREENSSFSHEERGILIQGIPHEEIIRGKRGIDQSKIRIF